MTGRTTSQVVATAGHVDHGKSTLVRALTGMEPDRWAEERRRGLTLDLGFAWTDLPSGREVAVVDVPGHERFVGTMLAGVGAAPVVCFVVAADQGWRAQSSEHRDAVAALGIQHGVVALTRVDLAADGGAAASGQVRAELAGTGLADAPLVPVSAVTGAGLDALRAALDEVLSRMPPPDPSARVRLWVDRSFSIRGAGTVVTGTLAAGTLRRGDALDLVDASGVRAVRVRGLHRQGASADAVPPVSRVAVNLREIGADEVGRGAVLVTPGGWPLPAVVDLARVGGPAWTALPERVLAHVGTAALPARLRPFDADHGRLVLPHSLPLVHGDRLVLRDPGTRRVLGGGLVVDADPPALTRRGDARRRATALTRMPPGGDPLAEVARRGAVRRSHLELLRLVTASATVPNGIREWSGWWVDDGTMARWLGELADAVDAARAADPLSPGLSTGAAVAALGLPDAALLDPLVAALGLESSGGQLRRPGQRADLGEVESAVVELERRWGERPFRAPEAEELAALELGPRQLAAAERAGRVLRLAGGVVLLPSAAAAAVRVLADLPAPFTVAQAREALDTTRRVAIPLLEHLDRLGWTRRLDAGQRALTEAGHRALGEDGPS